MTETNHAGGQIDYFEGIAKPVVNLADITALAEEGERKQAELDELNFKAQQLQQEIDGIYRRRLPELMKEAAMDEFKLQDGTKLSLKTEIKTSISAANAPRAYQWLEEHDFDGIIKSKVISEFGRGDMEEANAVVEMLKAEGIDAELNRTIHPATLKSFVKERLEEGTNLPLDLFGVFEYEIVKATKPRVKK